MKINAGLFNLFFPLLLAAMVANTAYAGVSPATSKVIGHLPVASNVTITPATPKAGEEVTASWTYHDSDNDVQHGSSVQWSLDGYTFAGFTGNPVTLPADAAGKTLQVLITPRSAAPADPAVGKSVMSAGAIVAAKQSWTGNFTKPDTVARTWAQAEGYCDRLSPAARLPMRKELQDLFVNNTSATVADGTQSNYEMCDVHGWPLNGGRCGGWEDDYWTSEQGGGEPYLVIMTNGKAITNANTTNIGFVTCVPR